MRLERIGDVELYVGSALESLRAMAAESIQTCVTSPPYWGLRDYGCEGQIGLEPTPAEYVERIVEVFREVRRVLRSDGTVWVNLGDSYSSVGGNQDQGQGGLMADRSIVGARLHRKGYHGAQPKAPKGYENPLNTPNRFPIPGLKAKDLIGIPWRVAFALQAAGWYLRSDIIWNKPNSMPESVTDRPTKAHEYIFLLSKSERYYYDAKAIKEPALTAGRPREKGAIQGATRNRRTVWTIPTTPYKGAHFATYPRELAETCILAGSAAGDVILDPFAGSGTTGAVALSLGRHAVLCELKPEYAELICERIMSDEAYYQPRLFETPTVPQELGL